MGANPLLETSDRDSIPGRGVWPQQFSFHFHLAAHGSGSLDHHVSACSASKSCLLRELAGLCPALLPGTKTPWGGSLGALVGSYAMRTALGHCVCARFHSPGARFWLGYTYPQATMSCCAEMTHLSIPAEMDKASVRSGHGSLTLNFEMWLPKLLPCREQQEDRLVPMDVLPRSEGTTQEPEQGEVLSTSTALYPLLNPILLLPHHSATS